MRKARAEMLIPGDIVAIYAGNETPSESAVVESVRNDEFTDVGDITVWTTGGRFDLPRDSEVDVLAWAPMPESTFTGPGGKAYYYDGTPEDLARAMREAE